MALLNFNAKEIDIGEDTGKDGFSAIHAGKYVATITDSELKSTRDGQGQYLQLTFQVADGQYSRRLVWDRLNLVNKNQQAVDIAKRDLAKICRALGIDAISDSVELHGKPLKIDVKVRPASGGYNESNEISGYYRAGPEAMPGANVPQAVAAQGAKQPTPPWGSSPGDAAPF